MVPKFLRTTAVLFGLVSILLGSIARAQCPDWSPGFEAPGMDAPIYAALVLDDGSGSKLYAAGSFGHAPGADAIGVARWNATAWTQVGAGLDGYVYALVAFDDGSGPKLAAGGLLRLAGETQLSGRVMLWDGSQWTALGAAFPGDADFGESVVQTLAMYDDGAGLRLYAAGAFGGGSVRRWTGSEWVTVGGGLFNGPFDDTGRVEALTVFDDGSGSGPMLYAGGVFSRTGSQQGPTINSNIARLSGTTWTGVGSGLGNIWNHSTNDLATFDDGSGPKLFAAGTLQVSGAPTRLAAWNGQTWAAVAGEPDGSVTSLTAFDAASGIAPGLYVGGDFDQAGGIAADDVARWDGAMWHAVGGTAAFPSAIALAVLDEGTGIKLFAAGSNGVVQRLDSGAWTSPLDGGGANGRVGTLLSVDLPGRTPELLALGNFTSIGGVYAPGLASWDGASWSAEDLQGYYSLQPIAVFDLGAGPELYGRAWHQGGGQPWHVVHRVGDAWTELPIVPVYPGSAPEALAVFDAGTGPALYASGANGLWRLDGTSWTSVIGQSDHRITGLLAFDDGSGPGLFLTGQFQTIGGVSYRGIARWNGQTLDSLNGGTSPNAYVLALRVYDDGTRPALHAGGTFTTIGGVPAAGLARWDGQAWSEVGGGIQGTFPIVQELHVHDDGSGAGPELVVGGTFSGAGGMPAGSIARWDGTSWRTMNGGISGHDSVAPSTTWVYTLASFDDGSGHGADLFVGGNFLSAGTIDSSHIARWRGCGVVTAFCFGDGTGAACPCANFGLPGHGCRNSSTIRGAELGGTGQASLAADTIALTSAFEPPNVTSIFLQGNQAVAPVFFGDGLRCVGGSLKRLYVANASAAGIVAAPASGATTISARSAELGDTIAAGSSRWYQVYYRDPTASFCPEPQGSTFNVSNGVEILWQP